MGVNFVIGDITTQQVDAIVNVINNEAEDGGNLNHAIHKVAGPELIEYYRKTGRCPTGAAKLTPGFKLPARYIIHTVAPVWCDGTEHEDKWMASCYQHSLKLAVENQCRTIAVPVFSFHYTDFPYETALQIAYDTCRYYLADKNVALDIYLVLYPGVENRKTGARVVASFKAVAEYVKTQYHKRIGGKATALFNTVAEYVKTQYQLDEKTKENLQIAQTVKPYFAEQLQVREITMPDGSTVTIDPGAPKIHYSIRSVPKTHKNVPDKEEFVPEDPFTKKLICYMNEKKMTAPLVYSKAGYDRKFFSKILSDVNYHPRKYTIIRFALALQLDLQETNDLLNAAGFALSRSLIVDLVISYCIEHNMRSVWEVNNLLESYGLEII